MFDLFTFFDEEDSFDDGWEYSTSPADAGILTSHVLTSEQELHTFTDGQADEEKYSDQDIGLYTFEDTDGDDKNDRNIHIILTLLMTFDEEVETILERQVLGTDSFLTPPLTVVEESDMFSPGSSKSWATGGALSRPSSTHARKGRHRLQHGFRRRRRVLRLRSGARF